jgi:hypothetical protein
LVLTKEHDVTDSRAHPASGVLSLVVKQATCEDNPPLSLSTKVKHERSSTSIPTQTSMACTWAILFHQTNRRKEYRNGREMSSNKLKFEVK